MFQVTIIAFVVLGTVATESQQTNIFEDLMSKLKSLSNRGKVEPEKFTVKFLLYTPQHKRPNEEIFIKPPNAAISPKIGNSKFDGSACTKLIIHGYQSYYPEVDWLIKMRDQFLQFTKCNVIVVDWSDGSNGTYAQAYKNTRTAAKATADFINYLTTSLDNVHILGCSLGAHTAGFVGHALGGKIGRITGLDPAGPGFTDPQVDRLNDANAEFVDVIHSDVPSIDAGLQTSFGLGINIGHIDFWPNNGHGAPGCLLSCLIKWFDGKSYNKKELGSCASCSHGMAANYYVDSINSTNPEGRAHQNGTSNNAPMHAIIGENAVLSAPYKSNTTGKSYYLTTKADSPYFYPEK